MEDVRDRGSGQLIIIAGFLVAVGIVVVTTSLNTVIFAQDLATRDDSNDYSDLVEISEVTNETAENGLEPTNEVALNDTLGKDGVEERYEWYMQNYTDGVQEAAATRGKYVNVSVESMNTTWRIVQNESGKFDNKDSEETYGIPDLGTCPFGPTVCSNTDINAPPTGELDEFYMLKFNITGISASPSDPVEINGTDTSTVYSGWRMEMWEDGGDVRIDFQRSATGCPTDVTRSPPVTIEVVNGSVNGSDMDTCWVPTTDGVGVVNGNDTEGTYEMRFERPLFDPEFTNVESGCTNTPGDFPCTSPDNDINIVGGILGAEYEMEFVSPRMEHNETVGVDLP